MWLLSITLHQQQHMHIAFSKTHVCFTPTSNKHVGNRLLATDCHIAGRVGCKVLAACSVHPQTISAFSLYS
jgi:hypothetical protein